jgi:O-antigen/teichoic acid export membrane protein
MLEEQWVTRRLNRLLEYLDSKSPAFLHKYWRSVDPTSIKQRFLKGAFWNSVGAVLSRFFNMGTAVFLARFLGKEGFGEYGMIFSTLGMFGPLASLQQAPSATYFVAKYRGTDKERAGKIIKLNLLITLVMAVVTAVIVFFTSPYLSENLLKNDKLSVSLKLASILMLVSAMGGVLAGILTGFEAFKRLAYISLLSNFFSLPAVVAGALWLGLPGAILGMILVQGIIVLVYYEDLMKRSKGEEIHIHHPEYLSELRMVLKFSLPTMAASMIAGPAVWAANALLVNQPGGYGEMGIFQAAQQWKTVVLLLPGLINAGALPVMANASANRKQFIQTVKYNVGSCAGLSLVTALGIMLFSRFIMGIYGKDFRQGAMVLAITVMGGVLQAISHSLIQVMISTNRVWANLAVNIGSAALMVGLAWLWVPKGLAIGLSLATLGSLFIIVLCQLAMVIRIIQQIPGEPK